MAVPLARKDLDEVPERWIEIKRLPDLALVTIIEILSPTNKSGMCRGQYLQKRRELLDQRGSPSGDRPAAARPAVADGCSPPLGRLLRLRLACREARVIRRLRLVDPPGIAADSDPVDSARPGSQLWTSPQ